MSEKTPPVTTGKGPPCHSRWREKKREREGTLIPPPDEVAQSASSKGERNVAQHNVPQSLKTSERLVSFAQSMTPLRCGYRQTLIDMWNHGHYIAFREELMRRPRRGRPCRRGPSWRRRRGGGFRVSVMATSAGVVQTYRNIRV